MTEGLEFALKYYNKAEEKKKKKNRSTHSKIFLIVESG